MNLEPMLGMLLADCFRNGSQIASRVGLAYVRFIHNNRDCTAYSSGKGSLWNNGRLESEWDTSGPITMVTDATSTRRWMPVDEYDAIREREYEARRKEGRTR